MADVAHEPIADAVDVEAVVSMLECLGDYFEDTAPAADLCDKELLEVLEHADTADFKASQDALIGPEARKRLDEAREVRFDMSVLCRWSG